MNSNQQVAWWRPLKAVGIPVILAVAAGALWWTQSSWLPTAQRWWAIVIPPPAESDSDPDHGHQHVDGEASGGGPLESLELSPAAWKNIGVETARVVPSDFVAMVSVPAMVVERPGRSKLDISAPMTGRITRVFPDERQPIEPGSPLFELRLTHEDVVTAQAQFLASLQARAVAQQELQRLQAIGEGVIPGKRIIEKEYEVRMAATEVSAARQSLLLHGMTAAQIDSMEATGQVLQQITIVAPDYQSESHDHELPHQFHVQSIDVHRGQSVDAGTVLCVLADHCLLHIEGQAYEDDAQQLLEAAREGTPLEVTPVVPPGQPAVTLKLQIDSIADAIDPQSRALRFYLRLPNQQQRISGSGGADPGFLAWKYRPGQRMEARIPTSQRLRDKIVLPTDAVVLEGPNAYVFEQNGEHFDRVEVHVLYRDKDRVVLENDGRLTGSVIATRGAYQMHLALKNQAGGAVDPHAGHSH